MQPWSAEQTVSEKLARSLIESQFPEFAPARVRLLGVGWDNTAYVVDERFVFRFPRRQLGAECLEAEIQVLPALVDRLPLPISAPQFVGRPSEPFGWPFAGYPMLPGRTACSAGLDEVQRIAAARPIAEFLKALHALGPDEARTLGAPPDRLGRLDPQRRIPQAHEYLDWAKRAGLIDDVHPYRQVIDATATARPPQVMAFVHGDLYARHLLVDVDGKPSGVIDWGDVHLGDIAVDLSFAHGFLPAAAHEAFRQAYGFVDEATWQLARFRALGVGAILTVYGHEIGDDDLLREGRLILRHVVGGT